MKHQGNVRGFIFPVEQRAVGGADEVSGGVPP